MPFAISKRENLDKEYYGWDTIFDVNCAFIKQTCKVELRLDSERPTLLYVSSETDGYHWLHYYLAQNPGCDEMQNFGDFEAVVVKELFDKYDIIYKPEDKETCYLYFPHSVTEKDIEVVAKIIEERFANRERFFD